MRMVDRSRSWIVRRAGGCLAGWLCLLPASYAGRHAAVYGPVAVDTTIGGTLQFAVAAASVNEDAGRVVLSVTRIGGSVGTARVAYATADGPARAGTNYTAASGTLSWTEGNSDPRITNGRKTS